MSSTLRMIPQGRLTIAALPLYYAGCLLKKRKAEKHFKGYHAELRGATIFLFQDKLQDTYTEKLDLEELKSIDLDAPYTTSKPPSFTLRMKSGDVQLKMENPNSGEEWRCYILTVCKKQIPSKIQLLPGQVLRLREVLSQESRRTQPLPSPPVPPRPSPSPSPSALPQKPTDQTESLPDVPACFFRVTRQEAEQMLESSPEKGALIIRPSSVANSYALTLSMQTPRGRVMKNFRVSSTRSGFVIELDVAVTVSSLHEVVKYFQEKTEYQLRPYTLSEEYDTRIDLVTPQRSAATASRPPSVPWGVVAPMPQPNAEAAQPPEAADGGYVCPDSQFTDDLKPGGPPAPMQPDGVLKLCSQPVYDITAEEEEPYENEWVLEAEEKEKREKEKQKQMG